MGPRGLSLFNRLAISLKNGPGTDSSDVDDVQDNVVLSQESTHSFTGLPSPTVSVVVATRDRAEFLDGLLSALENQTFSNARFEVLVVDDGSQDQTWETLVGRVKSSGLRLSAIRLSRSLGQGTARNVGIESGRAQIVAFTDDDCVPEPAWLEKLVSRFFDDSETGIPAMVVQGRTLPWADDTDGSGPWARTLWILGPTWLFETCNIAYRRTDIEQAGGFARRNEAPTDKAGKLVGEDALLGWEVVGRGVGLVFECDAVTYHRHMPASYVEWVLNHRGMAVFPALTRLNPLARRAMWADWFLARRTAAFDLALAGTVLWVLNGRRRWLAALIPWMWMALPEASHRGGRNPMVRLLQLAIGDFFGFASLVGGSIRSRTIVL